MTSLYPRSVPSGKSHLQPSCSDHWILGVLAISGLVVAWPVDMSLARPFAPSLTTHLCILDVPLPPLHLSP